MSNSAMISAFESFNKASEVLYIQAGINGVGIPSDLDYVPAYVVNSCFSIEVGLKYLLEQQGLNARGHELRVLFSQLDQPYKDSIHNYIKQFSIDPTKYQQWFDTNLDEVNEGFVNWRYFYEAQTTPTPSTNVINSVIANLNFLKRLRESIKKIV
ncbi:MAG: hypothetical protein PHP65_02150 [Bacilli bacterium]|jgi:hypothetical protein|nr:hypothetical protein [Bacilli bacterium]